MKQWSLILALTLAAVSGSQWMLERHKRRLTDGAVIRLTVWNVPPRSLSRQRLLWEETVRRFEAQNPGIAVVGVEREYRAEEFIAAMAGGKGPDLVKVWVGAVPTLARHGFLAAVDPFVENWSQAEFMPPVLWETTRVGDRRYGIPADTHFLFLLYRKDLFRDAGLDPEAPPADWSALVVAAKTLTRRGEGRYGLGLVPKTWYFQDFVWQAGGEMVREAGGRVRAAFHEPPGVAALNFWRNLRWRYDVLQPDPLMDEDELLHLFALGKVAMIFGTPDRLPALVHRYRMEVGDVGIAPLPAGPAGRAAHLGGQAFVLNASSPISRQEAAWRFVEFELSPANQLWKWTRMRELGMVIFPGAFSAAAQLTDLPGFHLVQDAVTHARVEPHVPGWPRVRDELDAYPLQAVLLDPAEDPASLLLSYARKVEREIFDAESRPGRVGLGGPWEVFVHAR